MEFLKKHYEKILLSVVLLCLAIAAAWFPMKIKAERQNAQDYVVTLPPPKELTPIDLSTNRAALVRLQNPPSVVLAGDHNLFNPVTWKVKNDGSYQKVVREGVDALVTTKIIPLYFELSFIRATTAGYFIGVGRMSQRPQSIYAKLNEKKDVFTIKEVRGEPTAPTELILELTDTGEQVAISKEKPYRKVEGYAADLRYEPDNLNFTRKKVNEFISFGGENYKIIAITDKDVRVEAISTNKRTTIPLKSAPKPAP